MTIIEAAAPRNLELGIELLDLRRKRINDVKEEQRKIFERMISECKRMAMAASVYENPGNYNQWRF